ncbi:tetratricopeptide repeat protein [Singulisphaera sp. Ch08]|uniref:Tetratricopeptide repeat protein n=1 Tax=Singulisphaera sp. Ch08 TaxID=3120278 RepID=A0AAU7CJQ2_9BACT
MVALRDVGFTHHTPGLNRRHFVTEEEIRVVLTRLPEEVRCRLKWVHLNDRFGRIRTLGYVNRGKREIGLCATPPRISLGGYLTRTQTPGQFGAIPRCQWPTLAIRRFFLYDVLLHELGHLQVIDAKAKSLRRKFAKETRAQEFAEHWCRELWSRPFDHADPVHNQPNAEEIKALRAGWALSWGEFKRGRIADKTRQYDEAFRHYERAVAHYPANAMALEQLGLHHYFWHEQTLHRSLEQAVAILTEAVRLDPALPKAQLILAMSLSKLEREDEARRCFERAIQIDPYHSFALSKYGESLADWEYYSEARKVFERTLRRDPQSIQAIRGYACCLANDPDSKPNDTTRALDLFQKAVAIAPHNADARYRLGLALLDFRAEIEPAKRQFEEALRLDPTHEDAANALEEIQTMSEGTPHS